MVSHMVQAAQLARTRRYDDDVVLACLLHDVGHMIAADDTGGYGVADHHRIGASFLRGLRLPERTCRAVELHVDAKRYLVGGGRTELSDASRVTLGFQGGSMIDPYERMAFEADPGFKDALLVRESDDGGKSVDMSPRELDRAFGTFYPLF